MHFVRQEECTWTKLQEDYNYVADNVSTGRETKDRRIVVFIISRVQQWSL